MRKTLAMGLFAVVAALFACKKSESKPAPVSLQQPSAAPAKLPKTAVPELAAQLGAIMRKPADFATSKDSSGEKTVTFQLRDLPGVGLASFVGYRNDAKAWRFGLEGARCELVDDLGIEVVLLERGAGGPLAAAWYAVKGGPLEHVLAKVFTRSDGLCDVLPGSAEYWQQQGEKPPRQ